MGMPPLPSSPSRRWEEEKKEYAEIEEQFKQFRVPSSVASSECGDMSYASSEWDNESIGGTEDGLSVLEIGTESLAPQSGPATPRGPQSDGTASVAAAVLGSPPVAS